MPRPLDEILAESRDYNGYTSPSRQRFGWSDRFGAAVDDAQGSLYGVGEAVGLDLGERRRRNQAEAAYARSRAAEDTGAPQSWREVNGVGSAARFVGGLAVDTAPHIATIAAGAAVGGPAGAAAAAYPLAAGDILQSQRDQAGRTNAGSAFALAVPYAAADALFGLEGAIVRRQLPRNAIRQLDEMQGVRGAAARAGATTATMAAKEAASETLQEGTNQLGRMVVDPNERFLSDAALDRFGEAAVGGAALGGVFGGAAGGWRRSRDYVPRTVDDGKPTDLTQPAPAPTRQLGLVDYVPPPPAAPREIETPNWTLDRGAPTREDGIPFERVVNTSGLSLAPLPGGETIDMFDGVPRARPEDPREPLVLTPPDPRVAQQGDLFAPGAAAAQAAVEPVIAARNQRGAIGQLPFNQNTTSPKGQVLMGLVESLAAEGHMEPGTDVQVATLIAQGKFAAAKKSIDEALKNKQAADDLLRKTQAAEVQRVADSDRRSEADEVHAQIRALAAERGELVNARGARPGIGSKKRARWDELTAQIQQATERWAALTSKTKGASSGAGNTQAKDAGSPAGAGAVARVQPAGGPGNVRPVREAGGQPAAGPNDPAGGEAVPPVHAGGPADPALEAVTSEALVETADAAKNIDEYEGALDELYRRWRDDGDEVAEKFFEDNAKVHGFAADLARVRERAGENKPAAKPASQGKRGIRLGRQGPRELTVEEKETDQALRALGALRQASAQNPDNGKEPPLPAGVTFTDGAEMAGWLMQNARSPFIRFLAGKLRPHLQGVKLNLVQTGDMLPGRIAAHLNGTARAVTLLSPVTGTTEIWTRAYDGNTEITWAHELLHAATMSRLHGDQTLRAPLRSLATQVRYSLMSAIRETFDADAEAMDFFQGVFRDTDEFLAYSTTSPTFQKIMQRLGPDGNWLPPRSTEDLRPLPEQSLWGRFVDMIRGLFGLPKAYDRELQKVLAANAEIEARNAAPQATLEDEIHRLLDELLAAPVPPVYTSTVIAGAGGVQAVRDSGRITQTETEAFKRWFGDSKVVDADGKPLVVYHGGGVESAGGAYTVFLTSGNTNTLMGQGAYFTSSPQVAGDYAARRKSGTVYPAYLSLKNPMDMDAAANAATWLRQFPGAASAYAKAAQVMGARANTNEAWLYASQNALERSGLSNQEVADALRAGIEAMGHDGIAHAGGRTMDNQLDEAKRHQVYIAFRPEQIKSAIGNRGTFDPNDADIRAASSESSAPSARPVAPSPEGKRIGESFAKIPFAHTTLGQRVQDALFNLRESPWALKWVTNDQIAEGYKHLKPVQDINRATSRMASVANRYLEVAAQTAKKWRALPDDVQLAMQKVMLKTTMAEAHVAIPGEDGKYLSADEAFKHEWNKHLDKDAREEFLELYQEWNRLSPAAKAVYDTVRQDLARQHEDTLKALRKSAAELYAGQLSRALSDAELLQLSQSSAPVKQIFKEILGATGSKSEQRALASLYTALRDIHANFGTVRGPYFPLVRFGDHVVVMKSQDLLGLEAAVSTLREQLQQAVDARPDEENVEGHEARLDTLRAQLKEAEAAVETAKQDEKKYVVEFYESPSQAERAKLDLQARYPGADVYRSVKEDYYRGLDGASGSFIAELQQTLAAALDAGTQIDATAKASVLQSMKDLYLRRQPERSALRAELKRMGIEGVQAGQMLRGYAQTARNGAWRISRLLHAGEVTAGLQALSQDRRSSDAKHVLNELKARFVGDLVPPADNKVMQSLSNLTYFMHLGFNISYFTTNATQAWVTSLPVMAGRHGIVNAANSLTAASKDVLKLLSQATAESVRDNGKLVGLQLRLSDEQIASLAADEGERAMLKTLTDDGVIDITIKHDLGALSDGTSDSIPGKVLELSSALANYPELYNRLSTALAAYRMEKARATYEGKDDPQGQGERYAEYIINRTHFNYSPENAPRMMRGQLGRLVFQFKRYQQGMIYLFAKLVKDATNGDKDAMRSLAYLLGTITTVGGVVSLPIAAPMALAAKVVASAYPDDDEPAFLQEWYNGLKDTVGETAAQMITKGGFAAVGLDLSGKLGQGNLLSPVPFANTDGKKIFSRDYFAEVGFALLGPGAALIGNEAEAVGYAKNGEWLKAAERGLPVFVANGIKAYRRADEGLATRAGDTLMEPDEFNAFSIAAKAVGFESVKVSDTYDQRSAYMGLLRNRQDARQALLRQYYEAVKEGDVDAQEAARERIAQFNERQPADAVRQRDLTASIRTHARRAQETREGLRVGRRDADTFERLKGGD